MLITLDQKFLCFPTSLQTSPLAATSASQIEGHSTWLRGHRLFPTLDVIGNKESIIFSTAVCDSALEGCAIHKPLPPPCSIVRERLAVRSRFRRIARGCPEACGKQSAGVRWQAASGSFVPA